MGPGGGERDRRPPSDTGRGFMVRARDPSVMSRGIRLLLAACVTGGGVVCSALFSLPAALFAAGLPVAAAFAVVVLFGELGYPLAGYAFAQTGDAEGIRPTWSLPDARGLALVVAGTLFTVGVNRGVFYLGSLAGVDPVASVSPPEGLSSLAALPLLAPVFVLVVGPAEEYLFRGVLQRYLAGAFSTWGAVGWTSVLFVGVHVPTILQTNPSALLVTGPTLVVVSLTFGSLYEWTDTLVVPALVHGFYDVAVFGVLLWTWSG